MRFVTGVASSQAANSALGTTWRAIASTPAVDARDNTGTNPASTGVPIYLLDGSTVIANSNADLWDGNLLNPLNVDHPNTVTKQIGQDALHASHIRFSRTMRLSRGAGLREVEPYSLRQR